LNSDFAVGVGTFVEQLGSQHSAQEAKSGWWERC